MQTIKVSEDAEVLIISAYAASNQQLDAVVSGPAWNVIGGFKMPKTATVKLEAVGLVSDSPGVVLSLRLFDVLAGQPVSGSDLDITEDIDTAVDSGAFELPGNKVYQIQAQAIGASGFAIVRTATLV